MLALGGAARLVEAQEMVMVDESASFRSPGRVQLVERPMGINTVGVVAWLLLLRTPEYPQGRQVGGPWQACVCVSKLQYEGSFCVAMLAGAVHVSFCHQIVLSLWGCQLQTSEGFHVGTLDHACHA